MRELVNYQSKTPSFLTKLLWRAAGADEKVLEKCSYTDHVKYAAIGGIIIFTALLASISAGFAIQSIFKNTVASVLVAVFWGIMIYNLDRFIVSATGKGDGKEGISWYDLKLGWPRIILAIIIGIVISAPLEVKIMEPEIERMLMDEVKDKKEFFKTQETPSLDQIKTLKNQINSDSLELINLTGEIKRWANAAEIEGDPKNRGFGPETQKKLNKSEAKEEEKRKLEIVREDRKKEVDSIQTKIDKIAEQKALEYKNQSGLMSRLAMAEHYAKDQDSEAIPWLIRLFFIILEITPILTKMMLIKSPYDYLSDNLDEITKAKEAIEIRHEFLRDENGQLLTKTLNYVPLQVIKEQKDAIEAQERLSQEIISEWEKREMKNAKDNLDDYISKT